MFDNNGENMMESVCSEKVLSEEARMAKHIIEGADSDSLCAIVNRIQLSKNHFVLAKKD